MPAQGCRMGVAARYVNKELAAVFTVVVLVLLLVALGGRFVGYLQDAASGKLSGESLWLLVALRLPEFLLLLLPFGSFLAVLLTLGRLYADQEMSILHGGGVGVPQLLRWLLVPMIAVFLLTGYIGLKLAPDNQGRLAEYLTGDRVRADFGAMVPGVFHSTEGGRRVTYTDSVSGERQWLENVFMAERGDRRDVTVWAERGTQYLDPDTGSRFLLLEDGTRYEGLAGSLDYRVVEFNRLSQRLVVQEVAVPRVKPAARSTAELFGMTSVEARAELQWRFAWPVFTVIAILLALGMSRVKPREGRFARVLPGVAVLLFYYLVMLLNQNALQTGQLPVVLGFWVVHAAFLAFALYLLAALVRPART